MLLCVTLCTLTNFVTICNYDYTHWGPWNWFLIDWIPIVQMQNTKLYQNLSKATGNCERIHTFVWELHKSDLSLSSIIVTILGNLNLNFLKWFLIFPTQISNLCSIDIFTNILSLDIHGSKDSKDIYKKSLI